MVAGDGVTVSIKLSKDIDEEEEEADEDTDFGNVVCPRFPFKKSEGWWVVIGNPNNNSLLSVKRVSVGRDTKVSSLLLVLRT